MSKTLNEMRDTLIKRLNEDESIRDSQAKAKCCELQQEIKRTLDALERPGIQSETRYVLDGHLSALLKMVHDDLGGDA